jgi:hypothetical protein
MSSNVNHGTIAAMVGFVLILLGWQGCSNTTTREYDSVPCCLLVLGITFLHTGLVEIAEGKGPQENPDLLQEWEKQNDRR